jgi:hypothetical protein
MANQMVKEEYEHLLIELNQPAASQETAAKWAIKGQDEQRTPRNLYVHTWSKNMPIVVLSKAFMATNTDKIFSGYQPC